MFSVKPGIPSNTRRIMQKIAAGLRFGKLHFLYAIFRFFLLFGISYLMLLPLFQMFSLSITDWLDIKTGTTVYWPAHPTFLNYHDALKIFKYFDSAFYTLQFTVLATVCQLVSTSLAGYGLARYRIKGSGVVLACVKSPLIDPLQN